MKTTVDAFGSEVIVGDTVVFFSPRRTIGMPPCSDKNLRLGKVIKCTSHGATVSFGDQKVNVRSGRIYKVLNGQQRLQLGTNESITIPEAEYGRLVDNDIFLGELKIAGVRNWDGYDKAWKSMTSKL